MATRGQIDSPEFVSQDKYYFIAKKRLNFGGTVLILFSVGLVLAFPMCPQT